ncbi:hypothetical protein C8R47DRAFT_1082853 [Mycena vitilis]|nr:hypothetical protein C8R47DRAFT_1082853 [Mycena vitilis]
MGIDAEFETNEQPYSLHLLRSNGSVAKWLDAEAKTEATAVKVDKAAHSRMRDDATVEKELLVILDRPAKELQEDSDKAPGLGMDFDDSRVVNSGGRPRKIPLLHPWRRLNRATKYATAENYTHSPRFIKKLLVGVPSSGFWCGDREVLDPPTDGRGEKVKNREKTGEHRVVGQVDGDNEGPGMNPLDPLLGNIKITQSTMRTKVKCVPEGGYAGGNIMPWPVPCTLLESERVFVWGALPRPLSEALSQGVKWAKSLREKPYKAAG